MCNVDAKLNKIKKNRQIFLVANIIQMLNAQMLKEKDAVQASGYWEK